MQSYKRANTLVKSADNFFSISYSSTVITLLPPDTFNKKLSVIGNEQTASIYANS